MAVGARRPACWLASAVVVSGRGRPFRCCALAADEGLQPVAQGLRGALVAGDRRGGLGRARTVLKAAVVPGRNRERLSWRDRGTDAGEGRESGWQTGRRAGSSQIERDGRPGSGRETAVRGEQRGPEVLAGRVGCPGAGSPTPASLDVSSGHGLQDGNCAKRDTALTAQKVSCSSSNRFMMSQLLCMLSRCR